MPRCSHPRTERGVCPLSVSSSCPLAASQSLACAILTPREHPLAIRRHGDGPDRAGIPPLKRPQLAAMGDVPELGRAIGTAGYEPLAVRCKRHGRDLALVAPQTEEFPAAGGIPHAGRAILAAGHEPLAVRRKGHGGDAARVPHEHQVLDVAQPLPVIPLEPALAGKPSSRPAGRALATDCGSPTLAARDPSCAVYASRRARSASVFALPSAFRARSASVIAQAASSHANTVPSTSVAATALNEPASSGLRRHQRQSRSAVPIGRALIGSSSLKRCKSAASSPAVA